MLILIQCANAKELETDDFVLLNTYTIPYPAFTQGLIYDDENGKMIESAGEYKHSKIRTFTLNEAEQSTSIPKTEVKNTDDIFAEGLAYLNGIYYQLTWLNGVVYLYDSDFNLIETKNLPSEMKNSGWGLATDGHHLYATSGTDVIFVIDPKSWKVVKQVHTKGPDGRPLNQLNECEIIDASIY